MSKEISESKKLEVVRSYFSGDSYEDAAVRVGVGKATVFAVVQELKNGEFPQYERLEEMVGAMRDMAVGLRKTGMSTAESIGLFILLKRFLELGVEPSQLEAWVQLCRSLPKDEGLGTSQIVQAAMKLARLESEQALSYEDMIAEYSYSAAGLKELEDKIQSSRTELTQLDERKRTLTQVCKDLESQRDRLEAEAGELTRRTQELSNRCRELEKTVAEQQSAVSNLEEMNESLKESFPQLAEKVATVMQEIAERTGILKDLEGLGFSRTLLDQLHARLAEMAARYGKDGLTARFFESINNYDSCLALEATRDSLTREVDALTRQRDSLTQLAEKFKLTPEEIGEAIAAVKALQKRGVSPPAIISYDRLLGSAGTDPHSFHKIVTEFGGLEQTLAARRGELETIRREIETERQVLEEMKVHETGTKAYLTFLKESAIKEVEQAAGSVKGEVSKLCQDIQGDIAAWGNVRGELGRCQNELKLARYFATIPLSEQATLNLVHDMDVAIVVQYLLLSRAWCRVKFNPKRKPPVAITKKYVGIADYTQVELADVITWALLVLAEGN